MKIFLPLIAVLLAGCASHETYMGHKVVDNHSGSVLTFLQISLGWVFSPAYALGAAELEYRIRLFGEDCLSGASFRAI